MVQAESRITAAVRRLEDAVVRLETAIANHPDIEGDEVHRLNAALRVAEDEQAALAAANRSAAERLEHSIGRLRGLLNA